MMKTLRTLTTAAALLASAAAAAANPVSDWNIIAIAQNAGNPFNQARIVATTQLAVFEAVNAIEGGYDPYLGTVVAPAGASADAAAIAAAHGVLKFYFPANAATLDALKATSLAAIPDGSAKAGGIATGEAAAAAILATRVNDGATPVEFFLPDSNDPYRWQLTPGCSAAGGVLHNWPNLRTFGIADAGEFLADPPPALTSPQYTRAFDEVKRVGSKNSTERPQDRTDVARFYAGSSPAYIFNMAARQISDAEGRSMLHLARALALVNMAISDAAVASFGTKYHYTTWRPETAIHNADVDDNPKTEREQGWEPLHRRPVLPCIHVKPRQPERSRRRGPAPRLRRRRARHHHHEPGSLRRVGLPVSDAQPDPGRHRRRARVRRHSFPLRPGRGRETGTGGRDCGLQEQSAEDRRAAVAADGRAASCRPSHRVGSTCVSVESPVRERNVSSCDPMRMPSPSASGTGAVTRSSPWNVPFLLPKSSSTAPVPSTRMRACRRDTVDASIRIATSGSRPITYSPAYSGNRCVPHSTQHCGAPLARGVGRLATEGVADAMHGADVLRLA